MSWPLFGYEYASILEPSFEFSTFFKDNPKRKVILDIPSTLLFKSTQSVNSGDRLWFFSREAFYMNWQTYHKQIIVGGANGYIPRWRLEVETAVDELPSPRAIDYLKKLGVEYIVFHKNMILFPDEDILPELKRSGRLRLATEGKSEVIFEIIP